MKQLAFCMLLLSAIFCEPVVAQHRKSPKATPVKAYKPPQLFSSVGAYKDTMNISVADAAAILSMPLQITDAKTDSFTVSSYLFLYREIVTTEDDSLSGRTSLTTAIKSNLFKKTPLPAIWQSSIRDGLKPGDELMFVDVIAKDSEGRVMYAPNIKLTLQ